MFTDEEKQVLEKYVTSADANIFAIKNMQGMVGAAYARYSRAKGGFREVLLKEFIEEGNIDPQHAHELIERVLIAYGDDSVGELEPAHLSVEKITMLAAKEIEDRRIGGSPIEQSTRYVLYDQKDDNGHWLYYRGDDVINTPFGAQYVETMDFIFQTYADLIDPLKKHLESMKPLEEAEYDVTGSGQKVTLDKVTDEAHIKAFRQTYTFELRAKACDILRSLLPIATLTNVGLMGNGRYFQGLISYLITTDTLENHAVAKGMQDALNQVIPVYIRRAQRSEYTVATNRNMRAFTQALFKHAQVDRAQRLPEVTLMDRGETILRAGLEKGKSIDNMLTEVADINTIAAMIYPYAKLPLTQLRREVSEMDPALRSIVAKLYIGDRQTRRDRPGRALEDGYPYTFDMVTNFGTYKDLQRHRMNTQTRQLFTTKLGFTMSPELEAIGAQDKVLACVEKADRLFDAMAAVDPIVAQYAAMHGHYIRWSMGLNDRALMHLTELRSTPQGHPSYRLVAQMMHDEISKRSEWRGKAMQFVDHNDYYWSRADSEAKQRVKEARLDEKLNK